MREEKKYPSSISSGPAETNNVLSCSHHSYGSLWQQPGHEWAQVCEIQVKGGKEGVCLMNGRDLHNCGQFGYLEASGLYPSAQYPIVQVSAWDKTKPPAPTDGGGP